MISFTTTAEACATSGVKVLTYGSAGSGKTLLCATAPAPIIISAEAGLLSLSPENIARTYNHTQLPVTYDIPVIPIRNVEDLRDAYDWCARAPEASQFQTVCLDSLSEIAEVVLNNARAQVKDPRQAYGELIEKMETLVRLFRDLPGKHVYMTAKMEPMKDEMSGVVKYGPSMPGSKLGAKLPYFFDEVFRMGVHKQPTGEEFRALQTQPNLQYEAKDRSGSLAPLEYPHLATLFNKITQRN